MFLSKTNEETAIFSYISGVAAYFICEAIVDMRCHEKNDICLFMRQVDICVINLFAIGQEVFKPRDIFSTREGVESNLNVQTVYFGQR